MSCGACLAELQLNKVLVISAPSRALDVCFVLCSCSFDIQHATFGSLRVAQQHHIAAKCGMDGPSVKNLLHGISRELDGDMTPFADAEHLLVSLRWWMTIGMVLVLPSILINFYLMCCARSSVDAALDRSMANARRRLENMPPGTALDRHGIILSVEVSPRAVAEVTAVWWQLNIPVPVLVISHGSAAV